MSKKIELEDIEIRRVICCLFNEAVKHKAISDDYKERGLLGLAG